MKGEGFMQLLALALILLLSGKNFNVSEFKPVLESLGGSEAAEALDKAEELTRVISAVQSFAGNANSGVNSGKSEQPAACKETPPETSDCPLAPIAAIADESITCALSRYIACGE